MENPIMLYQAAKLHHREIEKERANQVKITKSGIVKRFVMASGSFLKKVFVRPKQEPQYPDEHLVLHTNL